MVLGQTRLEQKHILIVGNHPFQGVDISLRLAEQLLPAISLTTEQITIDEPGFSLDALGEPFHRLRPLAMGHLGPAEKQQRLDVGAILRQHGITRLM